MRLFPMPSALRGRTYGRADSANQFPACALARCGPLLTPPAPQTRSRHGATAYGYAGSTDRDAVVWRRSASRVAIEATEDGLDETSPSARAGRPCRPRMAQPASTSSSICAIGEMRAGKPSRSRLIRSSIVSVRVQRGIKSMIDLSCVRSGRRLATSSKCSP